MTIRVRISCGHGGLWRRLSRSLPRSSLGSGCSASWPFCCSLRWNTELGWREYTKVPRWESFKHRRSLSSDGEITSWWLLVTAMWRSTRIRCCEGRPTQSEDSDVEVLPQDTTYTVATSCQQCRGQCGCDAQSVVVRSVRHLLSRSVVQVLLCRYFSTDVSPQPPLQTCRSFGSHNNISAAWARVRCGLLRWTAFSAGVGVSFLPGTACTDHTASDQDVNVA